MRKLKFNEAIRESTNILMKKDKNVIVVGLGVSDPKGIFGTTSNLHKLYGSKRVFEIPISENAITGIIIGASINGMRPILSHQRVEFSLLSIEQIFNQAAKIFYMTGGAINVPIVIRIIIGRGWGNGAQHTQSLESIFSHIPGLKVVVPSNAYDAKGLLAASVKDNNPVVFLEHRWLHNTTSFVPKKYYSLKIGKGKIVNKGSKITVIAFSYSVLIALKANKILNNFNINLEIIDLVSLRPIDKSIILKSVKKNKRVIVIDNGWMKYGISSEILSIITENYNDLLLKKPIRLGIRDTIIPSSSNLSDSCYPGVKDIIKSVKSLLDKEFRGIDKFIKKEKYNDIPDKEFSGPF